MIIQSRLMMQSQTVDLNQTEMLKVQVLSTTKIRKSQRVGPEKKAIILKSNLRDQDPSRLLLLTRISPGKIRKARSTIRTDN